MSEHWQFIAHFALNCFGTACGGFVLFSKHPWGENIDATRFGIIGPIALTASAISWGAWLWQIYHFTGVGP